MTITVQEVPLFQAPFYFVRHGESASNLDDTIAGMRDVPLTPRGHVQAAEAAVALGNKGITALYSSGLSRARETARVIGRALALPTIEIPALGERRWGVLEGRPRAMRKSGVTPPGAETPDEFRDRILRGFAEIPLGGLPLVVSHSGVFRALCGILGLPMNEEQVGNAQPVLFLPPTSSEHQWKLRILDVCASTDERLRVGN